jgi:hypothetical protein
MLHGLLRGGWLLAGLVFLIGCSSPSSSTATTKDEEKVREAFTSLQKALKAKDGKTLWSLLDEDSQADAERAAKTVRDLFAKSDQAKRTELEKQLGLGASQLKDLTGQGYLGGGRFIGKWHEIPDSKIDKVVVQGDRATLHYIEEDEDKEKLTLVRKSGEWKFSDLTVPQPTQP